MTPKSSTAAAAMKARAAELREREQNPSQSDFTTQEWLNEPEGREAIAAAEQRQRQREAFDELRRYEDKLGITD